jgi:hypothetical protein
MSRGIATPACTDPDAFCGTPADIGHWCVDFGVRCPEFTINPCVGDVPTPPPTPSPSPTPTSTPDTPTPTPEPTCNPATKPNNSNCHCNTALAVANLGPAFWDCGQGCSGAIGADYTKPEYSSNRGCPPNKYNDRDCCRCIVSTCDGQPVDPSTCECPSPSPTPAAGGGGPGDPSPYPPMYHRDCVDYYWVHFLSYDGGQTWQYADNEEYAGCFYVY